MSKKNASFVNSSRFKALSRKVKKVVVVKKSIKVPKSFHPYLKHLPVDVIKHRLQEIKDQNASKAEAIGILKYLMSKDEADKNRKKKTQIDTQNKNTKEDKLDNK